MEAAIYPDLLYLAAIVALAAVTALLAFGCRRLQERK